MGMLSSQGEGIEDVNMVVVEAHGLIQVDAGGVGSVDVDGDRVDGAPAEV